jgi:hypothetical protein
MGEARSDVHVDAVASAREAEEAHEAQQTARLSEEPLLEPLLELPVLARSVSAARGTKCICPLEAEDRCLHGWPPWHLMAKVYPLNLAARARDRYHHQRRNEQHARPVPLSAVGAPAIESLIYRSCGSSRRWVDPWR